MATRPLSQHEAGLKHGWRSGLEKLVGESLEARVGSCNWEFEPDTFLWTPETKVRRYTPDFKIYTATGKVIYVETKGRWLRADRQKLRAVTAQHPDLDLRLVFQNPNARLYKGSPTSYARWTEKFLRIPWAKGNIPQEWLDE
jgi:hypothetical protein